jgi:hypothetical protein
MVTAAPPKPPPPAPPPANGNQPSRVIGSTARKFSVSSGRNVDAQKFGIYGTGGIGKTKLASLLSEVGIRPLVVDVENGSKFLSVDRVGDIQTWLELRSILQDEALTANYGAVVIDSMSKAEELAIAHLLQTIPVGDGSFVSNIEGYGFGKGFTYAYETFLPLLGDLDALARRGKHIVVICHDCKANVPNPGGEDWIRYEHRLQETQKGPIRSRLFEWCDHFFYIGYDVAVSKEGKGKGGGTRTIYATEMPTHKAKSRDISQPIVYVDGKPDLWKAIFSKGE